MSELEYQWREPYQQALLELDPVQLRQKVIDAEAAITRRLQELSVDGHGPGATEERQAINDAISNLRILQTEKLQFPVWKSR